MWQGTIESSLVRSGDQVFRFTIRFKHESFPGETYTLTTTKTIDIIEEYKVEKTVASFIHARRVLEMIQKNENTYKNKAAMDLELTSKNNSNSSVIQL